MQKLFSVSLLLATQTGPLYTIIKWIKVAVKLCKVKETNRIYKLNNERLKKRKGMPLTEQTQLTPRTGTWSRSSYESGNNNSCAPALIHFFRLEMINKQSLMWRSLKIENAVKKNAGIRVRFCRKENPKTQEFGEMFSQNQKVTSRF